MKDDELRRFDLVLATFNPRVTHDLRYGADKYIGKAGEWEVMWAIDKEDGGPYVGEWAMQLRSGPYIGWVPSGDLAITEFVRRIA